MIFLLIVRGFDNQDKVLLKQINLRKWLIKCHILTKFNSIHTIDLLTKQTIVNKIGYNHRGK